MAEDLCPLARCSGYIGDYCTRMRRRVLGFRVRFRSDMSRQGLQNILGTKRSGRAGFTFLMTWASARNARIHKGVLWVSIGFWKGFGT